MVGRRLLALLLLLTLGCRTFEVGEAPGYTDPRFDSLSAAPTTEELILDVGRPDSGPELRVRAPRDIIVRVQLQVVVTPKENL